MRKRLSDITNLNSQHKSPFKNRENAMLSVDENSTKSYIDKLLQEIAEKDKIIESNGIELQKLSTNLRVTQLQNLHLAQSNSQMLAELNMAKDKLKILQHELSSKDSLVRALTVELKEKAKLPLETSNTQVSSVIPSELANDSFAKEEEPKSEEIAVELPPVNNDYENQKSKPKRACPVRSQSMGPTTSRQTTDKETVEAKRRCLRRQSMRSKPPEKQKDLFEIEVSNKLVDQNMGSSKSSPKSIGAHRSSIGRPQRRVTGKVVSYKENPVNIKMRRPE